MGSDLQKFGVLHSAVLRKQCCVKPEMSYLTRYPTLPEVTHPTLPVMICQKHHF